MGIFKTILGGLGFKQEEEIESYQTENTPRPVPAINEKKEEKNNNAINVYDLVCYAPKSNNDIKQIIGYIKGGKACIINLGGLSQAEIKSVLDYLGGAMCALEGVISRLQGELYVLCPRGVKVQVAN